MHYLRLVMGLVLVMLLASITSAKGQPDQIIISGGEFGAPIVIEAKSLVSHLSLPDLHDINRGTINVSDEPDVTGKTGYEIQRVYNIDAGKTAIERSMYYPGEGNEVGYLHFIGMEDNDSHYNGRWFHATVDGDRLLQQIIATNLLVNDINVLYDRFMPVLASVLTPLA